MAEKTELKEGDRVLILPPASEDEIEIGPGYVTTMYQYIGLIDTIKAQIVKGYDFPCFTLNKTGYTWKYTWLKKLN